MSRYRFTDISEASSIPASEGAHYVTYGIGYVEVLTGGDIPVGNGGTTMITSAELMDRLTEAEKDSALAKRKTDSRLDKALYKLSTMEYVDTNDVKVLAMLEYMVAIGVLTTARMAAIKG